MVYSTLSSLLLLPYFSSGHSTRRLEQLDSAISLTLCHQGSNRLWALHLNFIDLRQSVAGFGRLVLSLSLSLSTSPLPPLLQCQPSGASQVSQSGKQHLFWQLYEMAPK